MYKNATFQDPEILQEFIDTIEDVATYIKKNLAGMNAEVERKSIRFGGKNFIALNAWMVVDYFGKQANSPVSFTILFGDTGAKMVEHSVLLKGLGMPSFSYVYEGYEESYKDVLQGVIKWVKRVQRDVENIYINLAKESDDQFRKPHLMLKRR